MPKKSFIFSIIFLVSILNFQSCSKKEEVLDSYDLIEDFEVAEIVEETQRIDFTKESTQKLLLKGWSKVEKAGTWATSLSSDLRFYTFLPPRDQRIVFECYPFSYPNSPKQSLKLFLNGNYIFSEELLKEKKEYAFLLPGKYLKKGENVLNFKFNYVKSPADVFGKKDKRNLAAMFFSLYFPDKKINTKNIFKKKEIIFFNPLSQLNYYYKLPKGAHFLFDLDVQRSRISKIGKDIKIDIFITEDRGKEEKIFDASLNSFSPEKTHYDIDLSHFEEKIVRLNFRFDFLNTVEESSLLSLYAKLRKARIVGKEELPPKAAGFSKLPKEWKGIEKTNLIIAILDAVNYRHMKCYGYERSTTPYVDSIAAEALVFNKAYAHASWTVPSTASLFTSTVPFTHRVWSRERRLSDEAFTLAEALKAKGFKTCALTSNASASSVYKLFQGFDEKIELFEWESKDLESKKKLNVIWAEDFVKPAEEWIQKNKEKQIFMYIHFLQPHTPYNPPPPFKDVFSQGYKGPLKDKRPFVPSSLDKDRLTFEDLEYITAKYDENLKYADFYLEKILDFLKDLNIFENSIIVITADHGEAFLEHGVFGHSNNLYDEEIRIPLIIRFPKKYGLGGEKIDSLVQSMDLMPTFMDIYGQKKNRDSLQGNSLLPLLTGKKKEVNQFVLSSLGMPFVEEETRSDALADKSYKIIISKNEKMLFNLKSDPGEKNNIFYKSPILSGYYEQKLLKQKNEYMARKDLSLKGKFILDKKTRRHLKALGYIK